MTEGTGNDLQKSSSLDLRSLVLELTRALVDEPDSVEVDSYEDTGATVLRLRVSPRDLGKVIGKQGRTARSLRTILGAASMKLKHRYALDIVEVEGENDEA